ncbi:lysophospholipid acyltransferase family protein [Nocardia sp. NPDC004123]
MNEDNRSERRPEGLGKRAWIVTQVVRLLLRTAIWGRYVGVTVTGRETVPKHGPAIIASNHISSLDSVVLWTMLHRPAIFIAMAELWSWPRVKWLVRALGLIPVKRGDKESGNAALSHAERVLRHGGLLIIYPEGRLVAPGEHEPYKPGLAKLALATGAPIIPLGTIGTDRAMPVGPARGDRPAVDRRQRMALRFGAPIDPAAFDDPDQLLDHVRARIEDLCSGADIAHACTR